MAMYAVEMSITGKTITAGYRITDGNITALSQLHGQDLYDFITFINFAFEIYRHSKEFVRVLLYVLHLIWVRKMLMVSKVGEGKHQMRDYTFRL